MAEPGEQMTLGAIPLVVPSGSAPLWFLGTLARIKLDREHTAGRFGLFEVVLPHGAAPPLHSHPQDETFYVLEGDLTAWLVQPPDIVGEDASPAWLTRCAHRCEVGSVVFAPGGTPHTFRVESDTARLLVISTPAGIEDYVKELSEPAQWPWLQPPADGPRVLPERIQAVEHELGMIRHGPPPPPPHVQAQASEDAKRRS